MVGTGISCTPKLIASSIVPSEGSSRESKVTGTVLKDSFEHRINILKPNLN